MRFKQLTTTGWLSLSAVSLAACSGSAPSALLMGAVGAPGAADLRDSGGDAAYAAAVDGAADTLSAASSSPGTRYAGRGGSFEPDGGARSGPTDAADGDAPASPEASGGNDGSVIHAPLCPVTFTVTGALVDGLVFQNVVLGGDATALGAWDPSKVLKMAPAGGTVGVWTVRVTMAEGLSIHFKFGMSGGNGQVSWENATQAAYRALSVACPDGSEVSYVGQLNQVPDAGAP